ncbi:NTP transferase domain-containing protein [Candidatus Pyrohabitans sp.]
MKAVVLAAGKGERLGTSLPKPLVRLLGRALVDRAIDALRKAGIKEIIVVYSDPRVREHLNGRVRLVHNEDVEREGGYSLLKGAEAAGGEPFVLVMADHIFDHVMVAKLLESKPETTTLCVDYSLKGRDLEEATKVQVDGEGWITNLGKELSSYNALDTGVFYCTPEVLQAARRFEGRFTVTDVMKHLAGRRRLRAFDATGYMWWDVDTREELRRAEEMLLRSLIKPVDGFVSRYINRRISLRISRRLVDTPVTPNAISIFSFLLGALAGGLFAYGYAALGGIMAQVSSIIDGCDGEIARLRGVASPYGAFLDSTLDRYADMLILLGIIATNPEELWLVGGLAMLGSYSISYTGSRAELFGLTFLNLTENLMKRDVRLFLIFLAGVANQLFGVLLLLAVLCNLVVLNRFIQFPKLVEGAKN